MNYYPHHIGDYGSATAHLSMLEDAAYRLYERFKADLQRIVVDSGEYQRACAELARMCGV